MCACTHDQTYILTPPPPKLSRNTRALAPLILGQERRHIKTLNWFWGSRRVTKACTYVVG